MGRSIGIFSYIVLPEFLLWITLGQLGVPLEALGRLWGSLSARLGYLWELFGGSVGHFESACGALGPLLAELEIWASEGDPTAGQWLSSTAPAHKIKPPGILPRLPAATPGYPRLPPATRSYPRKWVRNCCSDPTSTRAGGQDDVS